MNKSATDKKIQINDVEDTEAASRNVSGLEFQLPCIHWSNAMRDPGAVQLFQIRRSHLTQLTPHVR